MVFGHYSITIQRIPREKVPSTMGLPPNANIKQVVRVGHMLWIPFFPLEKIWVMEQGDQTYKVSPQAEAMFDRLYTSERTPWYSFAGWIVLLVIGAFYFIGNKAESNRRIAEREAYLAEQADARFATFENPEVGDLYEFAGAQEIGARVTAVTPDSIEFEYNLAPGDKFQSSRVLARLDHDYIYPKRLQRVSRTDLTNSTRFDEEAAAVGSVVLGDLGDLQVKNVMREYSKTYTVSDKDLTGQLTDRLQEFLDQNDLKVKRSMLDRESLVFLNDLLRVARAKDAQQIRTWIDQQTYPAVAYYLVLQIRHHFVPTMGSESKEEEMDNLLLYLTLMDLPILTLDREKLEVKETAYLTGPTSGKGYIERPYNLIQGFGSETFQVVLNRENGQWLVNLPSSFQFYRSQIQKTASGRSEADRGWRAKVRSDLMELTENAVTIDPALDY